MTSFNLLQKTEYLLKNNKLVLLRSCESDCQKSFVASFASNRTVVDLSDPLVRERATWQPQEFLRKLAKPVLFYNLQYVPQLCQYLLADDVPNGTYLAVVGLAYYILEESYAQDIAIVNLPLQSSDREMFLPTANVLQNLLLEQEEERKQEKNVLHKIVQGQLVNTFFADGAAKDSFFLNYVKNYVQAEIKNLTTVSDDMKFYRFLCAAAAGTGSMVNYATLGKAADISSPTAKQWMSFLISMGVAYLLQPIETTGLKRVTKAPKLYFRDTGLAAYLLRIGSEEALVESGFFSALFDTYVVNAVREKCLVYGKEVQLTYFRDSNAKEISLLLICDGVLYPIEIKKDKIDITKLKKKLQLLRAVEQSDNLQLGNACIITLERSVQQLAENLWQVPAKVL